MWVLEIASSKGLTIVVHKAGYSYIIDGSKIKKLEPQETPFDMEMIIDYDAHKYTDSQRLVLSFVETRAFPGSVEYRIDVEDIEPEQSMYVYSVHTDTLEYRVIKSNTIDSSTLSMEITDFGTYMVCADSVKGNLKDISTDTQAIDQPQQRGNSGVELLIIVIIIVGIWIAILVFVRSIQKKMYRQKVKERTMQMLEEMDDVDETDNTDPEMESEDHQYSEDIETDDDIEQDEDIQ